MHRYQIEAAIKLIGGLDFTYKVRGDNQPKHSWVDDKTQKAALDAVLLAITPEHLQPSSVLSLIPPRSSGYGEIERHLFQDWDRYLIQSLQLKMLLMSHFVLFWMSEE